MYAVLMPTQILLSTACVVTACDWTGDGAGVIFDVFIHVTSTGECFVTVATGVSLLDWKMSWVERGIAAKVVLLPIPREDVEVVLKWFSVRSW